MTIPLGFEIGSGKAISIPLAHLAVTGQTRNSGKTSTLEALISRSGLRALSFVTKRAEGTFTTARRIQPYFSDRVDWQFVASILEATLQEKLKFERSWIMAVCDSPNQTLADVHSNVRRKLVGARGLNLSVLTCLDEYLKLILPQIEATPFAARVELRAGINVMDLSGMRLEMQMLVMRSALEWVSEREKNVVVVVPEAWEMMPARRGSPVKFAAEQFIRKGGALNNWLWLDSQDIAGVSRDILRSVLVWILGVQRDEHEVKRTLALISDQKPRPADVMRLGVGEFFVSFGKELHRVYVQPTWLTGAVAQAYARGALSDRRILQSPKPPLVWQQPVVDDEEEQVWKEKYEECKGLLDTARLAVDELKRRVEGLEDELRKAKKATKHPASENGNAKMATPDVNEIYSAVVTRLEGAGILNLSANKPELRVSIRRPVIELSDTTLKGKLAGLVAVGFFDEARAGNAAFVELQRRGFATAKPNVYRELDGLATLGIVTKESGGYQKAPDAVVVVNEVG